MALVSPSYRRRFLLLLFSSHQPSCLAFLGLARKSSLAELFQPIRGCPSDMEPILRIFILAASRIYRLRPPDDFNHAVCKSVVTGFSSYRTRSKLWTFRLASQFPFAPPGSPWSEPTIC